MAIKITFPAQATTKMAPSLYQWDYGQILEIESADLLPIVEVHFACSGMDEAIVRPCSVNNGLATVPIPDICLEHAGTIMAWVFEINGTEGMTRKTLTIPVIGRVKPAPGGDIPPEVYNRYTELVTELNEAITALTKGNVTVSQAKIANYAAEAGTANSANSASTAGSANYASSAGFAAQSGNVTVNQTTKNSDLATGLYVVKWRDATTSVHTDLVLVDATSSGNIYGTGAEVNESGPYYSAYSKCIAISTGCEIVSLWKIGVYEKSAG